MTYSRWKEDEVRDRLLSQIGETNRYFVDIGAGDGTTWSNTRGLIDRGWEGVRFEPDAGKDSAMTRHPSVVDWNSIVTPENVALLLDAYVPNNFDFLSLDIDGYDLHVLAALLGHYQPRVICHEFNPWVPPPIKFSVNYDPDYKWDVSDFYGASISAFHDLLTRHGYQLAEIVYDNAFWIKGPPITSDNGLFNAWAIGFLHCKEGVPNTEPAPSCAQAFCKTALEMGATDTVLELHRKFAHRDGHYTLSL